MRGLVPRTYVFRAAKEKDVGGRDEPGHDGSVIGTADMRAISFHWPPRSERMIANPIVAVGVARVGGTLPRCAKLLRAILALCLLNLLMGCGGSSWTYRFRIVVEVDTPHGLKTGSSVIAASSGTTNWGPIGARGVITRLQGDAVFVDLGGGKNVTALLATGPNAEGVNIEFLIARAFFPPPGGRGAITPQRLAELPPGSSARLSLDEMLTFVTFADVNDPKSVRVVYATGRRVETRRLPNGSQNHDRGPMVVTNEFATVFGPGYHLRGVTIEMVSSGVWPFNFLGLSGVPVTREIEKRFAVAMIQLRELDKHMQITRIGDPFRLRSGHLSIP